MTSTDRRYFHEMYRASRDPWNFETSEYERRKYAITMSALPRAHYTHAFEPGCSIGVLTEMLAERCDRVESSDIVEVALRRARTRVSRFDHVHVRRKAIPEEWPEGQFDLIVISELAYYFDSRTLDQILALVIDSTPPGAHVVGVHWRGPTDYPLSAREVHRRFDHCEMLRRVVHLVDEDFLLDVWERIP